MRNTIGHPISGGSDGDETPPGEPQFVPLEDFKRLEAVITGQSETLKVLASMVRDRPAPQAAPAVRGAVEEPSEDQMNQAILSGENPARLIKQAARAAADHVRRTEVEPMRAAGLPALRGAARLEAMSTMPRYDQFKDEIESFVDRLSPDAQMKPDAYVAAHNVIVGANLGKILNETKEAAKIEALRGGEAAIRDRGPAGSGRRTPGTTGSAATTTSIPTVRELLGEDAEAALIGRGMSENTFAKRLGYKNWEAYAKVVQTQRAAEPTVGEDD